MTQTLRHIATIVLLVFLVPFAYSESTSSNHTNDFPRELSVAPLDYVEYPDDRPEWINQANEIGPARSRFVVVSGPCDTPEESLEELLIMQRAALETYISSVTGADSTYNFYPLTDERIRRFVKRSYEGEVNQGSMTRYEHAVEVDIDAEDRAQIEEAWKSTEVRPRLGALSMAIFGGFFLLIGSSAVLGIATKRVESREKATQDSAISV